MGLTLTEFNALLARVENGYEPSLRDYMACSNLQSGLLEAYERKQVFVREALRNTPAAAARGAGLYARRAKDKRA